MIISNPACSPFMLVCSEVNDGCSISFIDVVPRSSELRTLLPLIAFSPIRKFSSAQPPCSEINSAASVSCSGLLIHVTSLVLGTGPLLSPQDTFDRTESSRTDSTHRCVDSTTENPSSARTSPSPLAASFNRIIQKSTASFKTTSRSVAVCSWRVQRTSLCLILFMDCCRPPSEGEVSCAMRLADSSGLVLDSVIFRGIDSSEGMEFVLQNPGCSSLFATRITNCDSTTIAENYLIVDEDRLDSTLIPHPTQNAITSRILYNLLDEATATLQRFAESAVEGRMIATPFLASSSSIFQSLTHNLLSVKCTSDEFIVDPSIQSSTHSIFLSTCVLTLNSGHLIPITSSPDYVRYTQSGLGMPTGTFTLHDLPSFLSSIAHSLLFTIFRPSSPRSHTPSSPRSHTPCSPRSSVPHLHDRALLVSTIAHSLLYTNARSLLFTIFRPSSPRSRTPCSPRSHTPSSPRSSVPPLHDLPSLLSTIAHSLLSTIAHSLLSTIFRPSSSRSSVPPLHDRTLPPLHDRTLPPLHDLPSLLFTIFRPSSPRSHTPSSPRSRTPSSPRSSVPPLHDLPSLLSTIAHSLLSTIFRPSSSRSSVPPLHDRTLPPLHDRALPPLHDRALPALLERTLPPLHDLPSLISTIAHSLLFTIFRPCSPRSHTPSSPRSRVHSHSHTQF
ncbi:hypothetical protein BLNAU_12579 [Blattamonas nauphoetae]|uniref:Uncharacterized protein n=1 Tax=Blattamonas nauphoetae TaxID=2049346 RepID=A0ABQ9XMD2_9EUKA|nr:hypothetical protein BLNAU_12579 [Blattamonas nauphoetae]